MYRRRSPVLATILFGSTAALAVGVVDGPTWTLDPNGVTPLAGVIEMETDAAVQVRLTIREGADVRIVDFTEPAQQHYLPVLGLKADRTYSIDVELVPGGLVDSLLATTAPLPADYPTLTVHTSLPGQMEPGYTLLDCFFRSGDPRPTFTSILDAAGEVVWYSTQCFTAGRMLPDGSLEFRNANRVARMDLLGNRTDLPLQDPGTGLHHDLFRTPHGTWLSLSQRGVAVDDFPTSETDPDAPRQTTLVRDEPVVEFLPDGSLRRQWPLTQLLDATRIGYNSLVPTPDGVDWVHTNAVAYDLADDSIVVSARHQDAVFKFSRATGALIWILGNHDNWSPEFQPFLLQPVNAPFLWQYHQHAPMWTGPDTLLLFDNGNYRASPFDGTPRLPDADNFSRGVEYAIDEQRMQVQQVWSYGEDTPRLYSFFISDADLQPSTGNRLMNYGGITYVDGEASVDLGLGSSHTRVVETTGDLAPSVVFDVTIFDPLGGRIGIYRAERLPDLYPTRTFRRPHGVGDSLRLDRTGGGAAELTWAVPPVDAAHDAADFYHVYASGSPDAGFAMVESSAWTTVPIGAAGDLTFYKVVAANLAGTSGDEPAP